MVYPLAMSDEPFSSPPRFPVTAEWLAEQDRKRAAYTESRCRYAERYLRHSQDEPEERDEAEPIPAGSPVGLSRRSSRGKVIDPRQLRFEV